jgi:hypothetical protein
MSLWNDDQQKSIKINRVKKQVFFDENSSIIMMSIDENDNYE